MQSNAHSPTQRHKLDINYLDFVVLGNLVDPQASMLNQPVKPPREGVDSSATYLPMNQHSSVYTQMSVSKSYRDEDDDEQDVYDVPPTSRPLEENPPPCRGMKSDTTPPQGISFIPVVLQPQYILLTLWTNVIKYIIHNSHFNGILFTLLRLRKWLKECCCCKNHSIIQNKVIYKRLSVEVSN